MTNTVDARGPVASGERLQRIDEVDAHADPASAAANTDVRINKRTDIVPAQ
jgi:hypothetical protein